MFICLEILEASRYKVRQCKSDRGVSTASSRYLALLQITGILQISVIVGVDKLQGHAFLIKNFRFSFTYSE